MSPPGFFFLPYTANFFLSKAPSTIPGTQSPLSWHTDDKEERKEGRQRGREEKRRKEEDGSTLNGHNKDLRRGMRKEVGKTCPVMFYH